MPHLRLSYSAGELIILGGGSMIIEKFSNVSSHPFSPTPPLFFCTLSNYDIDFSLSFPPSSSSYLFSFQSSTIEGGDKSQATVSLLIILYYRDHLLLN